MSHPNASMAYAVLVEEEVQFTLDELSRVCHTEVSQLVMLVEEGVLSPASGEPGQWRFAGASLARARAATRLDRDLELGAAGTALVLDLLDEISMLRARLRRLGAI